MSNISEFFLLVGTGHHYGGDGLILEDTISRHRGKGGWILNTEQGMIYWASPNMEDVLLMVSLLCVAPKTDPDSPFQKLRQRADTLFTLPLTERWIDPSDKKTIQPEDLRSLQQENKQILSGSNVKIVAVQLGELHLSNPDNLSCSPAKAEFLQVVHDYELKNVEFCEPTLVRYAGGFTTEMKELQGRVVAKE